MKLTGRNRRFASSASRQDRHYLTRNRAAKPIIYRFNYELVAGSPDRAAWFTTIHQLEVLGYGLSLHPYVKSYYERLRQRPAFRQESQIRGPLKIIVPAYRLYRCPGGTELDDLVTERHESA